MLGDARPFCSDILDNFDLVALAHGRVVLSQVQAAHDAGVMDAKFAFSRVLSVHSFDFPRLFARLHSDRLLHRRQLAHFEPHFLIVLFEDFDHQSQFL